MEASFYPEFTRPPPTKLFTGPQLGSPLAPAPRCIKGLDLLRYVPIIWYPHRNQPQRDSIQTKTAADTRSHFHANLITFTRHGRDQDVNHICLPEQWRQNLMCCAPYK